MRHAGEKGPATSAPVPEGLVVKETGQRVGALLSVGRPSGPGRVQTTTSATGSEPAEHSKAKRKDLGSELTPANALLPARVAETVVVAARICPRPRV